MTVTVTIEQLPRQSRSEARLIAGQLWLADRLAELMPMCCPATAGVWACPHRCVVMAPGSEAKLRDCWLAAAAHGTRRVNGADTISGRRR